MPIVISALYKFVAIADVPALRESLLADMQARGMKGTLILAPEGINGTISAETQAMAGFLAKLRADARFADVVTKDALSDVHPFRRLKVKIKPEIVTLRVPEANPARQAGTYVAPEAWNALIGDPDVLVLDVRNAYEIAVGSFPGAIDPGTRTFCELPAFVESNLDPSRHKRIAMFCTGGIRCEKASAYLKHKGFAEVYHLEGGILGYLARVPPKDSLWQGACFVFDEREAVHAQRDENSVLGFSETAVPEKRRA